MSQIRVNHLTFAYEGSFDNIFENVSFSIDVSGMNSQSFKIYAYINVNGKITNSNILTSLNDWDNWIKVSVSGVSILSTDTVSVGVHITYTGTGGWGYLDNATLSIN